MKCAKCNNEIQDGAEFCSYCGASVENNEPIKKISLKCEKCNGTLTVDSDKTILACPYCGHQSLIIENDAVTIERIRTSAYKEIEMERIRSNDRLHQMENEKEERLETKEQVEKFKKGKLAKFLIIAFLLSAVLTFFYFSSGRILAGVLALVQVGCFGSAWCLGMNIIKEKKRYIHILVAIVGIVLIVPTMRSCVSINESKNIDAIKWSIIFMGDMIPEPNSKTIEIHDNEEDDLWINVHNTSETEYYEYIVACKELGYTVGMDETPIGYSAYNEEGYHLDLSYNKSNEKMNIQLKAPTEVSDLNWSEHKISSILPEPKSAIGAFTVENDKTNKIVVSNSSRDDFLAYCDVCKDVGFTIDTESKSELYTAYDENGNKVSISYNSGNKEMTITFEYPMEFKDITWPTVGIGTLAPVPNSLSGNVSIDYDWCYSVYLENVTREEYEAYVQNCIDAGFSKDISNYGDSVWANYSDDIKINVAHKGFNIMYVSITGSLNEDYSSLTRKPGKDETVTYNNINTENTNKGEYSVDFKDSNTFESVLNSGERVNGKIVCFEVLEYKPNSALGINCWSGEHLNFISETEPGVQKGDIVIGRITAEPSKSFGSWKIPYEVIAINLTEEKVEVTKESETTKETENTKEPETTKGPETTMVLLSEYEKAYIREMSNYSLYIMFDEDSKEVVCFGTNDTYVMKGSYSGSFSSGVIISWDDGWDEKFMHSSGSTATLIDGNGFDWNYKVCDVEDAQEVLDSLK